MSALSWLGLLGLTTSAGGPTRRSPPRWTPVWALIAAPSRGCGSGRKAPARRNAGIRSHDAHLRDYAHDTDISYGEHGARNHLDIWRRPDLDRVDERRSCCRCPAARGWSEANASRPIR